MPSMQYRYSSHDAKFRSKLKKLLSEFPKHRKKILAAPFASLPWKSDLPLGQIRIPRGITAIAVCGIGGSSLGAKSITHALSKHSVIYFNNVDPDFVHRQFGCINPKKTLFLLISKSGETIEILSLASFLLSKIRSRKNFLAITDMPESSLGKLARREKIPLLASRRNIPGRLSVLSLVGLLPPALLGVSVKNILEGAQQTSWKAAYALAVHQYLHFKNGKNITPVFSYSEALSPFIDWYIQLLSESIGKSKRIGITPLKALGVKDQHAQLQLFLDGPDDKFYIFIKPEKSRHDLHIAGSRFTFQKLFDAEYFGVRRAFEKNKKPFLEISLPSISESALGELFFFFELEIAFLGSLFHINYENQPAVELSKRITKSLLARSGYRAVRYLSRCA